jgi:formate hydrogenlyase subunit 6/NADH:ubiquinone oxidoreductase subunit I
MIKPGKMASIVLEHVVKKPATEQYPYVKRERPDKFRGKLKFLADKCIGCKLCMRDCPSDAIVINKVGEKQFECILRLDRCVYCAQCVDTCPKKALETTKEYELAALDKNTLKVVFDAGTGSKEDSKTES